MKRKPRIGEFTCTCGAYKFPHRFGGGRCTGYEIVSIYWENNWGTNECANCILCALDENTRQVVQGVEKENQCPVFQEFTAHEEIRLLGPYWG